MIHVLVLSSCYRCALYHSEDPHQLGISSRGMGKLTPLREDAHALVRIPFQDPPWKLAWSHTEKVSLAPEQGWHAQSEMMRTPWRAHLRSSPRTTTDRQSTNTGNWKRLKRSFKHPFPIVLLQSNIYTTSPGQGLKSAWSTTNCSNHWRATPRPGLHRHRTEQ